MGHTPPAIPNGWDWNSKSVIEAIGTEIGIEDLTIEFPAHQYTHHEGPGFLGIQFKSSSNNCWIKNVAIVNYDEGVHFRGAVNCTADGVYLTRNAHSSGSHFDVAMTDCAGNLATNIRIAGSKSVHGLAGNWNANTNVFSNVVATNDLILEPNHNSGTPPQNAYRHLYSNIGVENGTLSVNKPWQKQVPPAKTNSEGFFWNVNAPFYTEENINTGVLPADIHSAQLARRLGGGRIIVSTTALAINEGANGIFTVRLETEPASNVAVAVARTGDVDVTALPESLTFTTTNWNTLQTVTLSAATDADTINDVATITVSSPGLTSQNVAITVTDTTALNVAPPGVPPVGGGGERGGCGSTGMEMVLLAALLAFWRRR
jgi:hypothetical protein